VSAINDDKPRSGLEIRAGESFGSRGEREERRERWAEMPTGESEKRSLGGFQIRASRDLQRRIPFTRTVSMDP
jgi:hypothetical protein